MSLISSDRVRAVVGLGVSGISCARFLSQENIDFYIVDSRNEPPGLEEAKSFCPHDRIFLGNLDILLTLPVTELYVSPGIPLSHPVLKQLSDKGVLMRGDIDLFCDYANAPIVAITGSNAKSTVTTLVADMLNVSGYNAVAGGNLGATALDLLSTSVDYYVLELSSFQLETTHSLSAAVATVLNVSEDHMDRYDSLYDYQKVKQRIYRRCRAAVCNKQDILTVPLLPDNTPVNAFTIGAPDLREFGLLPDGKEQWLCYGVERLINTSSIKLKGKHNYANILAALAILKMLDVPFKKDVITSYLSEFEGLPHRCQTVKQVKGAVYINDSKGTNVGATIAALDGFGSAKPNIHLILGGDGKGADFSPLVKPVSQYVKNVYLFGADAGTLEFILGAEVTCHRHENLDSIIMAVSSYAQVGDIVLFSPACASLDMYSNYKERGEHFIRLVRSL
ncbi:UDP-N-acetylmuramoyl-L-alanine--D-glutamate ligase [Marinomonas sp. 15G1-11]|uniref:UDP-N-acetylmuramoylalanine--D-glutamate ligase n=1 Tax=Marinomonas phaeophyticola TaxID=3004091 RepID=A0ABT4JXI9_9GAMM|nr:UDP-N-acetylmuramoyl-L-alanine--D-glutamate ligase [Marinomonas sp. 15G1-11]MCZ2723095.1 UDP-N-acetylmuramoyl-L-alanine--D-glutamate ligase [Marinomonas sp. 15G1-11]